MRSHLTLLTASLCAGLLCASSLRAQEKPTPSALGNLALEIVGDDVGMPFPVPAPPSRGGYIETSPPKRLANWKQPPGVLPLTRVRIHSTYEGDGVRIKLAAVFDDSELADESVPKYGEKELALASYFAREGETATVEELSRFGFEPMRLKVVREFPRRDEPEALIQPQIANPLQSVTVVSFESEASPSTDYRLTLRNLSAKSIIALEVHSSGNGGRSAQVVQGSPGRPLMRPGATHQISLSMHAEWLRTPQGLVPHVRQETWRVGTVIFDDDTYEGELKTAADITGGAKGRRVQLARALRLFQKALDAPEQDAAVTLEELKSQVSMLRIDVEASLVEDLVKRFPQLSSKDERAWIRSTIMSGLKSGREEALFRLKDLEEERTHSSQSFNLQQSIRAINQRLVQRIGNH